ETATSRAERIEYFDDGYARRVRFEGNQDLVRVGGLLKGAATTHIALEIRCVARVGHHRHTHESTTEGEGRTYVGDGQRSRRFARHRECLLSSAFGSQVRDQGAAH